VDPHILIRMRAVSALWWAWRRGWGQHHVACPVGEVDASGARQHYMSSAEGGVIQE